MAQIDTSQIKPEPYFTIRTANTITSGFNPVSSTWTSMGSIVQTGLIDPDYVTSRIVWNSVSTDGMLESGGSSNDTRVNLSTSQIEIPGSSGSAVTTLTHAVSWQAPYLAISAYVAAGFGAGSTRLFRISYGNGTNGFYLEWDEAGGTVKLKKEDSGATTLATFTGSLTAPFELGLSLSNLSLSAQLKSSSTAEWHTLCGADIPTNDSLDPRQPARLAAANTVTLGWTSAGTTSASLFKLGTVTCGYVQGINGLADQPVCFSDGTPIQRSGEQFIVFSNSAVSGSSGTAIPTALFQIMAVDPTRNSMRTQAKIFTNNSGTGITGNNSGTMVYHPATDKYYWLITNYGDPAVVSDSSALKMFFYVTNSFPSGIVVLQNPVAVAVPGSATLGTGDPCLRFNLGGNGVWGVVFSQYAAGYSAFAPTYATIADITTCATGGNWTQVAHIAPSGVAIEGNKFLKLGGTQYIIAALNSTTQAVYDLTLSQLGTLTDPPGGGATATHACWLVYHEGNGNQRVYWYYFDKTEYGFSNFTHGRTRVAKSTTLQLGQDFDRRILADV